MKMEKKIPAIPSLNQMMIEPVENGYEESKIEIMITQNILGQAIVYISLNAHDWSKLEESPDWKEITQHIEECQTLDIHLCRQDQQAVLGMEGCKNHESRVLSQFCAWMSRLLSAIFDKDKKNCQ